MVNSYAALTYLSFIRPFIGIKCSRDTCTRDVANGLSTIFLSGLFLRAFFNVFVRQ
eukprot:gene12811-17174_t